MKKEESRAVIQVSTKSIRIVLVVSHCSARVCLRDGKLPRNGQFRALFKNELIRVFSFDSTDVESLRSKADIHTTLLLSKF